ncbi:MAG: LamG domain-containing protein [bacterium]|nr:LamG domain-containing protein [bacterium]
MAAYFQQAGSGATALDSSGNGYTGTITAGAGGWAADNKGNAARAYDFDALNTKIDTGSDWIGTVTTTVSAWIYADSYGEINVGRIIDNGKFIFSMLSNKLRALSDGSTATYSLDGSIQLNTWYYVTLTRTSAGVANFYVNGALSGSANQASGTPVAGTTNVIIGNNTGQTTTFDGRISDVRIYNRVLSAAEILAIYNSTR